MCVCVCVRVFVCTGSSWANGEGFGDNMRACVRRGAWDMSVTRDSRVQFFESPPLFLYGFSFIRQWRGAISIFTQKEKERER